MVAHSPDATVILRVECLVYGQGGRIFAVGRGGELVVLNYRAMAHFSDTPDTAGGSEEGDPIIVYLVLEMGNNRQATSD